MFCSGDSLTTGIVYSRVAELGLLGGLGCGRFLVESTINRLIAAGEHDYIVLQATKMAIPFYERMGFIRLGAVARLGDQEELPEISYRHWRDIVKGEVSEFHKADTTRIKLTFSSLGAAPGC